jgi:hypothetical protein
MCPLMKKRKCTKINKTIQAIENYDKSIKSDPNDLIAFCRIGEGLQKLGKYA